MKTETEKQPVEPEAQPLKEEDLNEVSGGIFIFPRLQKCKYCGEEIAVSALDKHIKTVHPEKA